MYGKEDKKMLSKRTCPIICLIFLVFLFLYPAMVLASSPPESTMKLVFIHHSVGENWLQDANGGLGRLLGKNNYCGDRTTGTRNKIFGKCQGI